MSGFHPKDLIKEVKIRPGIYNRDELVHPKRDHKHQLWMEVAERLTPPEDWESYTDVEKEARMDEIATKWKHLKDHFYREIKLQEAGEAHKKRKYIYFDDLEFMRPFVGFKLPPINKRTNKSYESLETTHDYVDNDADIDMDAFLKTTEHVEEDGEFKMEPDNSSSDGHPKGKRVIRSSSKALQNKSYSSTSLDRQNTPVNKNYVLKKPSVSTNPHFKIRDGDISFSLSLVPTLRKLSDGLKLRAKIDILKILQRCVDDIERKQSSALPSATNHNNAPTLTQIADVEEDMTEDHLEEYEETINIKHEQHDDPLTGSSSNNKTWWT